MHTFGLHPAGSAFVQTATGKTLLGDWIGSSAADPTDRAYGRLLRGLLLAVFHYTAAEKRPTKTAVVAPYGIRVGGRGRPPTRTTDRLSGDTASHF